MLEVNAANNTERSVWEIKLAGEIDIANADVLKNQIAESLAEAKQDIELDLWGLSYIDSTGLGVIMGAYAAAKKDGYSLKLLSPKDNVKKLLNISGLDKIIG